LKESNIYSISLGIAALLLLTILGIIFSGNIEHAGLLIMAFFALLALGFSGYKSLNSYVFTASIFAGVALALYYPEYFLQIGGFELTGLIIPLIQLIMFGMGTSMQIGDFAEVIKSPGGLSRCHGTVGYNAHYGLCFG